MTGETPNPLDVLRRYYALNDREYRVALAQVEALAEAARVVVNDPMSGRYALRAALAPFVAHKDTA